MFFFFYSILHPQTPMRETLRVWAHTLSPLKRRHHTVPSREESKEGKLPTITRWSFLEMVDQNLVLLKFSREESVTHSDPKIQTLPSFTHTIL